LSKGPETAAKRKGCSTRKYTDTQARIQGGSGGRSPTRNFFAPLEKCVGHNLKILDIVQKIWALSENSSPLLVFQAGYGPADTGCMLDMCGTNAEPSEGRSIQGQVGRSMSLWNIHKLYFLIYV